MIITLCGSARFESHFHLWNEVLTLSGHTVFGLAAYPSTKRGNKNWYSFEEKTELDKAHFRKISVSDAIFVLNRMAYVGESTLNEINYAIANNKKLFALESWGIGCGIGRKHIPKVRDLAKKYGVYELGSQICTTEPFFKSCWDLLPPAGSYRSKLVDKVNKEEYTE